MFHVSNFGSLAGSLADVADLNGFVPEPGDRPEQFTWDHDEFTNDFDDYGNGYEGYADGIWEVFVSDAQEALRAANLRVEGWQTAQQ